MAWERKRILIWGKTRPELSSTYRETVCTGGVFEENGRLVRLYPIPLRYWADQKVFKKYQWITADVMKNPKDTRPESYRIRDEGVEVQETIPTKRGDWSERAKWILRTENQVRSVERLQAKQVETGASLGILKPAEIKEVLAEPISKAEKDAYWRRHEEVMWQQELQLDGVVQKTKPLGPSDYRFQVRFRCDDSTCNGHTFSILDWEVDALYFTIRQRGHAPAVASDKVLQKLREEVCSPDRDPRFFLGNISNHPKVFTIVGLWRPKKEKADSQGALF